MLRQLTIKFLHRVRIHGGEFDSSARAMNRAEEGDFFQADLRKFRGSTFERKQMSTTIKRIALVAVAALSLGVLSVAPSQAANSVLAFGSGDSAGTDNTTGYAVAGAFNYATVNVTSAAADYVLTTDSTFVGQGDASPVGALSADAKALSMTDTGVTGIRVATPAVGTVTVKYWVRTNGVLAATAAETVVITVNATKQSGAFSAAKSTAFIVAGETNTTVAPTADATVTGLATANVETATASIQIALKDALGANYADTVTATVISGGANVKAFAITDSTTAVTSNVTAGLFSDSAYSSIGRVVINVHANGTSGPTQVRLTLSDGTVLATKSLTFSSTTVATLTPTVVNAYVSSAGKAGAVTVIAKDASGFVVPGAVITATSGDTTKISSPSSATTDSTGKATFTVAAASSTAAGAATITFKTGVATATASVTAAGVKATKISITPDVTAAEAGSKITFTMTVADANGPLADGDYVGVFVSAPVTSNGSAGAFASDTVTVLNGKATSSVFLPFIAGTYTSTWTVKAAGNNVDSTIAATTIEVPVVVTNASADAATDAANEAAQAASDATDAAILAAEAADAATAAAQDAVDAVAALSTQVNKLISALKAQITTLTNLVIKIQKKVRA